MTYKARYMHRRAEKKEYWLTLYADTLLSAQRQAERWAKKGFICVSITQDWSGA